MLFLKPNIERLKAKRNVRGLIAALHYWKDSSSDEAREFRRDATRALCEIGVKAVEPLIAALEDDNHYVRYCAIEALGQIGDVQAVEALLSVTKGGKKHQTDLEDAALALGRIGDVRAIEPLIATLRSDVGDWSRASAAECLGQIGDARAVYPLVKALTDRDDHVRTAAAKALGALGDARALKPLINVLSDQSLIGLETVATALERLGEPIGTLIYRVLKGDQEALEKLTKSRDRRAVELLIAVLESRDWSLKRPAARALGCLGDTRGVEPLIKALIKAIGDNDRGLYEEAVEALRKIADPRIVVESLITMLGNDEGTVRSVAATSLGKFGDPLAIAALVGALKDPVGQVRKAAASALERFNDTRATDALRELRADEERQRQQRRNTRTERLRDGVRERAIKNTFEYIKEHFPKGEFSLRDLPLPGPDFLRLVEDDLNRFRSGGGVVMSSPEGMAKDAILKWLRAQRLIEQVSDYHDTNVLTTEGWETWIELV